MISKRYDFMYFFDVQDGNPNGDPDAGNLPRIDVETGAGLVTDVCLKRKIRNYVDIVKHSEKNTGYDIFVKEKAVLNRAINQAWDEANPGVDKLKIKSEEKQKCEDGARTRMCKKFYDVRAFGAVMTTGEKGAGQVRGPIQLTFARSVEPVVVLEHAITRMAVTNEKDAEKERTIGRKFTIPYGLYCAHGFVSAFLANQTDFTMEDLNLLWKALEQMFEHDHSAARGLMSACKLIIFEHETALGNAPAHDLFRRVECKRATEGPARSFTDYVITLDGAESKSFREIISVN